LALIDLSNLMINNDITKNGVEITFLEFHWKAVCIFTRIAQLKNSNTDWFGRAVIVTVILISQTV